MYRPRIVRHRVAAYAILLRELVLLVSSLLPWRERSSKDIAASC
jgi:hypothetical protein